MNRILRRLCRVAGAGLAVAAAVASAAALAVPASAAAPASAAVADVDAAAGAAVLGTASQRRAGPRQRPPQTLKRYAVDGKVFYDVAAPCCDQFNALYEARGQRVCAPDGGITGHGDGRCPGIHVDPHEGGIVWRAGR